MTVADAIPAIANWQDHAQTIRKLARQRHLAIVAKQVYAKALAPCADIDRMLGEVETMVWEATRPTSTDEHQAVTLAQALAPHIDALENPENAKPIPTVPIGMKSVDAKFGETPRGEILVLAGRPGTGKTSFALQCIEAAAKRGDGCAVISAEMRKAQLSARLMCQSAGLNSTTFRRGMMGQQERTRALRAAERLSKLPVIIDDQRFPNLGQLRRKARRMKSEIESRYQKPMRMLVIDHFHRLNHEQRPGEREDQAIARYMLGISTLAAELDVMILMLAQLSRASDARGNATNRPRMSDLKGGSAIEENAFQILMLYRPEILQPDDPQLKGICEVICVKARDGGETGIVQVSFDGPTTSFHELDQRSSQQREYDDIGASFGDTF
jgi:replicative DNA helicase